QLEPLDLAGSGRWQGLDELDPAWPLVICETFAYELLQFVRELWPRVGVSSPHERHRFDQSITVRPSGHTTGLHQRMLHQGVLEFDGTDPDTSDLEHVVGSTREPEEAVSI